MEESGAMNLVRAVLGREAISAERMTLSHSGNVIFDVTTSDGGVIARIREDGKDQFAGTERNLAAMAELGLPVPRLLASDSSRMIYPFAYMLLEKISGRDLYYELPTMTRPQMTDLAARIVDIQRRVRTLPPGKGYGWGDVGEGGHEPTWFFVFRSHKDATPPEGGTPAADLRRRLHFQQARLQSYFRTVAPTCFLEDLTTKNVLLEDGEFRGIIDFDSVCFGDPLWMIGLVAGCIIGDLGDEYLFYIDELRRLWNLTPEQNQVVTFYAAVRTVEFLEDALASEETERAARIVSALERLVATVEYRRGASIPAASAAAGRVVAGAGGVGLRL